MKAYLTFIFTGLMCCGLTAGTSVSRPADAPIRQQSFEGSFWQRATLKIAAKRLKRMANPVPKCAVILKKDGTEMMVRIISKNNKKITYKPCDHPAQNTQTISTDSIQAVRMPDDWLWVPLKSRDGYTEGKNKMGNWSLILGILAWLTMGLGVGFILAIVSLGLGITSLKRKYKRRTEAIFGVVLSALLLILAIAVLLILFAYFTGD